MAIQLSPSVLVQEMDFTNVIPAVAASAGATIVDASWGPVMEIVRVDSENNLVQVFGKPNSTNFASWFTAANFLAYTNNLSVVRPAVAGQLNAVSSATFGIASVTVNTAGSGFNSTSTITFTPPALAEAAGGVAAEGILEIDGTGVSKIIITNPGAGYLNGEVPTITWTANSATAVTNPTYTINMASQGIVINNDSDYTSRYVNTVRTASPVGEFCAKFPGKLGNNISIVMVDNSSWAALDQGYKNNFSGTPGTSKYASDRGNTKDELHILVIDISGAISGAPGTVLEKFEFLSKYASAKNDYGSSIYYPTVITNESQWIRWLAHPTGSNWGNSGVVNLVFSDLAAFSRTLDFGADNMLSTDADKMFAFSMFDNKETSDISLIMAGKASPTVARHVIDNIVTTRKDCMVFISPYDTANGKPIIGTSSANTDKLIAYKNLVNNSTSYAVYDSGFKYQYDRYNDAYVYTPLCADVAGLCARTDATNDPWWSPAGFNRGQIKNIVKLAYNPRQTERDVLYLQGINPVVSFPGAGIVLYGDKTALAKPSAFDRINVRRLFITLQKAISTAAKYQLFEFNDGFTRNQFKNMVEPYLRDVKGRRGIIDFKVVCDESNNTAEVIDGNRFVADIYIKPARSINYVQLNFVATRSDSVFNELTVAQ